MLMWVDAILIHSKEKNPKEIFDFSKIEKLKLDCPLIAVFLLTQK